MKTNSFKVGDWVIVKSYEELINNGNGSTWSYMFARKIGVITELFPKSINACRTTIHDNAIFEYKDLNKFGRGI